MKKYSKRPPRILVLGPPGSGKTTVSEFLANKYRLVLLSAEKILENEIKAKTLKGQISTDMIEKNEPVPDRIIGKLIEDRLNQPDCRINGWILEGFPANEVQARILRQTKQNVSLVVELELDDDDILQHNSEKRIDPITGRIYNMKSEDLMPDPTIESRLISRECDSEEALKIRLKQWKSVKGKLLEPYKDILLTVGADSSIKSVCRKISKVIKDKV